MKELGMDFFAPPVIDDNSEQQHLQTTPFLTTRAGTLPVKPRCLDHALYMYGSYASKYVSVRVENVHIRLQSWEHAVQALGDAEAGRSPYWCSLLEDVQHPQWWPATGHVPQYDQVELATMYQDGELTRLWDVARQTDLTFNLVSAVVCFSVLLGVLVTMFLLQQRPVYLVDYHVHRAPDSWKVTRAQFDAIVSATKDFGEDSLQFMSKVLHRSGLGDETYAPPSIVITNSSLFNTTPSLSATIMNHFKMSSKTLNYNLAGMGCSA
eukprot:gene7277-7490_t